MMMNMVVRYIWMYLVMGLVLNTAWAIGLTIFIGNRCKWDDILFDECMDILVQHKGLMKFLDIDAGKKLLLMAIPIGYLLWPINIAYGASRVPAMLDHINMTTKKTEA